MNRCENLLFGDNDDMTGAQQRRKSFCGKTIHLIRDFKTVDFCIGLASTSYPGMKGGQIRAQNGVKLALFRTLQNIPSMKNQPLLDSTVFCAPEAGAQTGTGVAISRLFMSFYACKNRRHNKAAATLKKNTVCHDLQRFFD